MSTVNNMCDTSEIFYKIKMGVATSYDVECLQVYIEKQNIRIKRLKDNLKMVLEETE